MSVVQRCPNCGTNQAAAGECDACHEARVRYYCTNHEPGIWLAGPTCPTCDAPVVMPVRVPPRVRPVIVKEPVRERRLEEDAVDLRPARPAIWASLLRSVLARPAARTAEPAARGWVMRLILRLALIAMILVAAVAVGIYMLARSL